MEGPEWPGEEEGPTAGLEVVEEAEEEERPSPGAEEVVDMKTS